MLLGGAKLSYPWAYGMDRLFCAQHFTKDNAHTPPPCHKDPLVPGRGKGEGRESVIILTT